MSLGGRPSALAGRVPVTEPPRPMDDSVRRGNYQRQNGAPWPLTPAQLRRMRHKTAHNKARNTGKGKGKGGMGERGPHVTPPLTGEQRAAKRQGKLARWRSRGEGGRPVSGHRVRDKLIRHDRHH